MCVLTLKVNSIGRTAIVETLLDAGMDPNCFDGASGIYSTALINSL